MKENVLGETQGMIPDTKSRLSNAVDELNALVVRHSHHHSFTVPIRRKNSGNEDLTLLFACVRDCTDCHSPSFVHHRQENALPEDGYEGSPELEQAKTAFALASSVLDQ